MAGPATETAYSQDVDTAIENLNRAVETIENNQVFGYFSQWSFEGMLDAIALEVQQCLAKVHEVDTGCTLLYRASDSDVRYITGGSSAQRTRMDPSARLYFLDDDAHKRAFTTYSIRYGQPLAFNRFKNVVRQLSGTIRHQPKDCELPHGETNGYCAIPGPLDNLDDRAGRTLECKPDCLPEGTFLENSDLPIGLLRVTLAKPDLATHVLRFFLKEARPVLDKIFRLIKDGRHHVQTQKYPNALAIADLNSSLLHYRNKEYEGLEALAAHLQTVFGQCECSIFRASPFDGQIHLYLAATTALSSNQQHVNFRKNFFDRRKHYTCRKGSDGRLQEPEDCAKTEKAYYRLGEPVYDPDCEGAGKFTGCGEWETSTSFLALAIPSPVPGVEPYGVIRLVRGASQDSTDGERRPFNDVDKQLAAAIAKSLNYWLEFFPRNDALKIEWASDRLRLATLRTLFNMRGRSLPDEQEAEIEFRALLCKLFVTSKDIAIRRSFGGYSGAAVLLIRSDTGPDIILKCAKKLTGDTSTVGFHENAVTNEVKHYNDFIQGKILLNHNIIYPDAVRETRRVNGFVSSFVGSRLRGRQTVAEFVTSDVPTEQLFHVVSGAATRLTEEVWQWWYRQAGPRCSSSVERFLQDGLHASDVGWHLANNRVPDLESMVDDASRRLTYDLEKSERPTAVSTRFQNWANTHGPITWDECVTHGDLHGGNLFVDPKSEEVWLIDFARTGRRASVFDLATLEAYTMFRLLPSILKARKLLDDPFAFIETLVEVERTFVAQRRYGELSLPEVSCDKNPRAAEALRGAIRTVTNIRLLLHDELGRRGPMTDYLTVLFLQTFRHMSVRGASDGDSSNLGVLLAARASGVVLDALVRYDQGESKKEE